MKFIFGKIKSKFALLIGIGIILRIFLMFTTLHSDIWALILSEDLFVNKGVVNIYDYLGSLPPASLIIKNYGPNFFTYPPLTYFTFGLFGFLSKPFYGPGFLNNLSAALPSILKYPGLPGNLFLGKFPFLLFDVGVLLLLSFLFDNRKKRQLAVTLWLFNPLSLYTSFMVGQFDIIPVFFTVLSVYFAQKNKDLLAALFLGIGGAYKMFPLFFLPFLLFYRRKKTSEIFKEVLIGIGPFFLSILPFIGSSVFRQDVLASNQSQKMLFSRINVSGAEYLSLFVVVYCFLLFLSLVKKREIWEWFLLVMLLFFSVTHYHPQWFLWLTPFLVMFWVKNPGYRILVMLMLVCWFVIMLFFEPSLSISLFSPLNNSLVNAKPFSEQFNKIYDVFQFKSIIRSIFAGASLFLFYKLPALNSVKKD